jgi:hypothetical protein
MYKILQSSKTIQNFYNSLGYSEFKKMHKKRQRRC